jgi:hypothetical protein
MPLVTVVPISLIDGHRHIGEMMRDEALFDHG